MRHIRPPHYADIPSSGLLDGALTAGGPGFEAPRLADQPPWLKAALAVFRVILLDQRGTGLSTPVTQLSLQRLGPAEQQAAYLKHFRCACITVTQLSLQPWALQSDVRQQGQQAAYLKHSRCAYSTVTQLSLQRVGSAEQQAAYLKHFRCAWITVNQLSLQRWALQSDARQKGQQAAYLKYFRRACISGTQLSLQRWLCRATPDKSCSRLPTSSTSDAPASVARSCPCSRQALDSSGCVS